MDAIDGGLTGRDAHNNFANVETALQRAEGELVLRLHVETSQRQASSDCRLCSCTEQQQHTMHPRRF